MSSGESPLYPSIRQLPLLGVAYADLYRRIKIQEAVYETLTKQYELAKVQEAKEIPTVKVLDPGELPREESCTSQAIDCPDRTYSFSCCGLYVGSGKCDLARDR